MKISSVFLFLALFVAAAAACGGSTPPPEVPSEPEHEAEEEKAAEPSEESPVEVPDAWQEGMTEEQAAAFMEANIVPAMAAVFTEEEDFGCKKCHGPDNKEPHDFLPRLTFQDGNLTAFAEKPEVAQFMAEKVVPAMAAAMGLPPYDVSTGEGFGCGGCHAIDAQ